MSADPEYPCNTKSLLCSKVVICAPKPELHEGPVMKSKAGIHIATSGALLMANIGTGYVLS